MFRKLKARCAVIALAAIMLTFITQGTLAYYTSLGIATSVVTSGGIELVIHEKTDTGEEFPRDGVYIVPGDIVSKQITIENVCEHPFYLRVKMVYGIDNAELTSEDCFKLNINPDVWTFHDGWYYYNGVVNAGETTPKVFSHVEIVGSKVDNSYLGKTLTLTVDAQAVQSENNKLTDGKVYTALGWPAE